MSLENTPETPQAEAETESKALTKLTKILNELHDLRDDVVSIKEHKECIERLYRGVRCFRDSIRTYKTDEQKRQYQRNYYARRKEAAGQRLREAGTAMRPGRKSTRVLE